MAGGREERKPEGGARRRPAGRDKAGRSARCVACVAGVKRRGGPPSLFSSPLVGLVCRKQGNGLLTGPTLIVKRGTWRKFKPYPNPKLTPTKKPCHALKIVNQEPWLLLLIYSLFGSLFSQQIDHNTFVLVATGFNHWFHSTLLFWIYNCQLYTLFKNMLALFL